VEDDLLTVDGLFERGGVLERTRARVDPIEPRIGNAVPGEDGDACAAIEEGRDQGAARQPGGAGDQHPAVAPGVGRYHRFHGALARHAVSSASWSATVSMHCQ
jgi:hypothetical protein